MTPLTPDQQAQARFFGDQLEAGEFNSVLLYFQTVPGFFPLVGALLADERFRVRAGVMALVEELDFLKVPGLGAIAKGVAPLLAHEKPHIRGDAASLLEVIGDSSQLPALQPLLSDPQPQVAQLAQEAVEAILLRG